MATRIWHLRKGRLTSAVCRDILLACVVRSPDKFFCLLILLLLREIHLLSGALGVFNHLRQTTRLTRPSLVDVAKVKS